MVEIMKRVHESMPDMKFYLVGVGFYAPMLEETKALVSDYGLDDFFIMKPWLTHAETLGYLKYAQLYVTTSLYEGLPIAVLEAMGMGKAVVASDVIGNNDCVKDNYNGKLIPMDADVFANVICEIMGDKTVKSQLEKNAMDYFESKFLINKRISELENIYSLCMRM